MLPFLSRKEGSASLPADKVKRTPDEPKEDSGSDMLETVIKELFEAKTDKARAEAFRAAFELLEQEPHEEANHG